MRIYDLKKMSIPKVAVLAAGLVAAFMVATIHPAPVAQAYPSKGTGCTACHDAGGTVTATPSAASVAPGAAYTVALAFTGGSTPAGYAITGNGANVNASDAGPASMTAPATAGSYTYTVWMRSGVVATTTYTITVGSAPTTVPPTTVPPTTIPPTTIPPTTMPPTTVPPTTVPPTTVPPTTVPPTTEPPVTTPPVATGAVITSMSPTHGVVGSPMTITGTGFGTAGSAKFGADIATSTSWTDTSIVVTVPARNSVSVPSESAFTGPIWYRHGAMVLVTVTPQGAAASIGAQFRIDLNRGHHYHHGWLKSGHDNSGHDGDRD